MKSSMSTAKWCEPHWVALFFVEKLCQLHPSRLPSSSFQVSTSVVVSNICFMFTPLLGEMVFDLTIIFVQMGGEKPPPSKE